MLHRHRPDSKVDESILQLFDLEVGPGEATDLSPTHPEVIREVSEVAGEKRDDLGDSLTSTRGKGDRLLGCLSN